MVKTIYFDTNVFNDIYKRRNNVTSANESALRYAIQDGRISIVLSILNFEEKLCAFNYSPDITLAECKFMQALVDWDKFVKVPEQLLEDDIRSYAQSGSQSSPFMINSRRKSQVCELLNSGREHIAQFLRETNFLQEVEDRKRNFQTAMTAARDQALCHLGGIRASDMSFSRYWNINAERLAQALVRSPDMLAACQERGIDGLLDIRSVRLCVGSNLSLVYAQDFEGRQPEAKRAKGDAWDLRHAVVASAADMFVTHDRAFADLIKRIPIGSFEVLHLHDLLNSKLAI